MRTQEFGASLSDCFWLRIPQRLTEMTAEWHIAGRLQMGWRALVLVATVCIASCASEQEPVHPDQPKVRLLGKLPIGSRLEECVFSRGGSHVAYVTKGLTQWSVWLDRARLASFEAAGLLTFSPDGSRLAYGTREGRQAWVVLDGKEGPRHAAVAQLTFSSDGRHFAYGCNGEDGARAVVDGQPGPAFASVGPIAFSPDGLHVAYQAILGKNQQVMVVDHKPGPVFSRVEYELPTFLPGSAEVAYAAEEGSQVAFALRGNSRSAVFETVMNVCLSPDGKRLAYTAGHPPRFERRLPEHAAVIDEIPGPTFELVGPCAFSPDGRHFAYAATRKWKYFLVVDHQVQSEEFSWMDNRSLTFAPDGSSVGFIAQDDGKKYLVGVGQKRSERFDRVYGPLTFSDGNRELGFGAYSGGELSWRTMTVGDEGKSPEKK